MSRVAEQAASKLCAGSFGSPQVSVETANGISIVLETANGKPQIEVETMNGEQPAALIVSDAAPADR